jgi:hypothetical protein
MDLRPQRYHYLLVVFALQALILARQVEQLCFQIHPRPRWLFFRACHALQERLRINLALFTAFLVYKAHFLLKKEQTQ